MHATIPQDDKLNTPLGQRLRTEVYDRFQQCHPMGYEGGLHSFARDIARHFGVTQSEVRRQLEADRVLVQQPNSGVRRQIKRWRVVLASELS